MLGSELWESKFELLSLVKEYIIDVWEIQKHKLYDSDSGPGQQLVTKDKPYGSRDSDHTIVHLGLNVSSSAHNCGCVVDGGNTMAAI